MSHRNPLYPASPREDADLQHERITQHRTFVRELETLTPPEIAKYTETSCAAAVQEARSSTKLWDTLPRQHVGVEEVSPSFGLFCLVAFLVAAFIVAAFILSLPMPGGAR